MSKASLIIAGVVEESIVDGPGVRFAIFVQGCPHRCPGCHNPATHPFEGGSCVSVESLYARVRQNPLIRGVTFTGGEPFCQARALSELGAMLREDGYDIFIYSGYILAELLEKAKNDPDVKELLAVGNYLVDGRFIRAQRDLTLRFRGSRNQKIYDITCYPNSERIYEAEDL